MPSVSERVLNYVMTEYRSLVVVVFALPLSLLWNACMMLRAKYVCLVHSAPAQHKERVERIRKQVVARPKGKQMCTSRPGWMSMSLSYRTYKKSMHPIEMSGLIDIVCIDTASDQPFVIAEPLVTMGQLSRALLPLGYTLPIVPEMDDLTVGGLSCGTGIESSSHRYGLFHETCLAYEICLGDGTLLTATAGGEHAELFHAWPWSYGTLGLLLSVSVKIVPCLPFVRLEYSPFTDRDAAMVHFAKLSESETDYVEAIVYSATDVVVMAGYAAASVPPGAKLNTLSYYWKPWFFKHVQAMLTRDAAQANNATIVEYIPLRDYYHRHTKSMFWEMELMVPIGNHPLFRYVLGWMMPPKVSFLKLTQTELTRRLTEETHVAQDFLVPMSELGHTLDFCHTLLDQIYPVWLCPHNHGEMGGSLLPSAPNPKQDGSQMYVDVGVYGLPRVVHDNPGVSNIFNMREAMRAVEAKLRSIGGVQMLYADIFCTREEFEAMFAHGTYREVRKKYRAVGAFPEVFDKMHSLN